MSCTEPSVMHFIGHAEYLPILSVCFSYFPIMTPHDFTKWIDFIIIILAQIQTYVEDGE